MPALPTIDYHRSVGPGPSNKKKKRNERYKDQKEKGRTVIA